MIRRLSILAAIATAAAALAAAPDASAQVRLLGGSMVPVSVMPVSLVVPGVPGVPGPMVMPGSPSVPEVMGRPPAAGELRSLIVPPAAGFPSPMVAPGFLFAPAPPVGPGAPPMPGAPLAQGPQLGPMAPPPPGYGAQPAQPTPAADNLKALTTIAEQQAQRLNATILVDPSVYVPQTPKTPDANLDIVHTMDSLASQVTGGTWRKLYLPHVAGAVYSADKVAAIVKALETVEQSGVVLENPKTDKLTSYLKNIAVPANLDETLEQQKFDTKPIYFLTSTSSATPQPASGAQRLTELQREMTEALSRMSPQQAVQATSSAARVMLSADPRTRLQVGAWLLGFRNALMSMNPQMRDQLLMEMDRVYPGSAGFAAGTGPGGYVRRGGPMVP